MCWRSGVSDQMLPTAVLASHMHRLKAFINLEGVPIHIWSLVGQREVVEE